MRLLVVLCLFLGSFNASAAIKITGVEGASANNLAVGTGTNVIIYGGVAGDCNEIDSGSTTTVCNSCAKVPGLNTCNRQRIYPALRLRISFKSDSTDGKPFIVYDTNAIDEETTTVAKNNTATVDVTWSKVCEKIPDLLSSTCDSTGNQNMAGTFKIGIDSNGDQILGAGDDTTSIQIIVVDPDPGNLGEFDTIDDTDTNDADPLGPKKGVSGFLAVSGDEKIYLEDLQAGSGFPATPMGTLTQINVYASSTGWITKPSDVTPKPLKIESGDSGFSIPNSVIKDLDNGKPYYIRVSVSDPAGNEVYFTSDASIAVPANCNVMPPALPVPPFDGSQGNDPCPFAAYPDQVLGLLNKDLNCFIATAAYGSPFHPIVRDLRKFRDQFLMTNSMGRAFVKSYYKWSPPAADWLREHTVFKWLVRILLVPVWLGSLAAMWWPFSVLVGLIGLVWWRKRTFVKRG